MLVRLSPFAVVINNRICGVQRAGLQLASCAWQEPDLDAASVLPGCGDADGDISVLAGSACVLSAQNPQARH